MELLNVLQVFLLRGSRGIGSVHFVDSDLCLIG